MVQAPRLGSRLQIYPYANKMEDICTTHMYTFIEIDVPHSGCNSKTHVHIMLILCSYMYAFDCHIHTYIYIYDCHLTQGANLLDVDSHV